MEGPAVKTCLVVDDSRMVRKLVRRILEGLDFVVDEAADGEEALVACRRGMPDAIVLDWHMPVMSGPEFLAELRHEQGGEGPKVIFCTAENDLEHIAEAMQAGGDEYIMKPFDAEILKGKLEQVGLM
jgi:two-component system chemotaxis response regulator CheY